MVYLQAALSPIALPRSLDPTLRLAGWDILTVEIAATAGRENAATVKVTSPSKWRSRRNDSSPDSG